MNPDQEHTLRVVTWKVRDSYKHRGWPMPNDWSDIVAFMIGIENNWESICAEYEAAHQPSAELADEDVVREAADNLASAVDSMINYSAIDPTHAEIRRRHMAVIDALDAYRSAARKVIEGGEA